jgi:hypothetical protein
MHITTVTYERLYNLGNYENERLVAQVAVGPDEDVHSAFFFAKSAVEEQHARLTVEREEAEQRKREEWEAEQRRRREEREAQRLAAATPATTQGATDEPPF